MKKWTWQKWIGKLAPIFASLLSVGIWEFLELPAPTWAGIVAGGVTFIAQWIISLIPPKTVEE